MDMYPFTVALHSISLALCFPFAFSQYRLRNWTLLALTFPVTLLHTLLLTGFVIWGKSVDGLKPWECALRKGIYVYACQGIYLLSAIVIIRLWMITYGYEAPDTQSVRYLERRFAIVGLLIPLAPALFASAPQWISGNYTSDIARLNKCSAGYIHTWQVFASGSVFTILPTGVSLIALGAICMRLFFLLRHRDVLVPQSQSRRALYAALSTLLRVLLLCVSVGATELYYICADFIAVMHDADDKSEKSSVGHFLISIWGMLLFLVFGTSRLSRSALRGRLPRDTQGNADNDRVYAGTSHKPEPYGDELDDSWAQETPQATSKSRGLTGSRKPTLPSITMTKSSRGKSVMRISLLRIRAGSKASKATSNDAAYSRSVEEDRCSRMAAVARLSSMEERSYGGVSANAHAGRPAFAGEMLTVCPPKSASAHQRRGQHDQGLFSPDELSIHDAAPDPSARPGAIKSNVLKVTIPRAPAPCYVQGDDPAVRRS
ncbi:hypothetical protein THASP1DRAFT_23605 [Thamnocephalis sphaerospora]|uniref:Uncharacterized protein n=1 Tax=Thamnocephalis sphaerospora TaxID=78915 RepID=A0A4P9XQS1_9FUNG|nr:hypothetical protein THASP1DRAFT_23605 [Thamnocephalis sphaerospora]|eukprot:RKP08395.1 hypothetical protein THASP1DRAFT_23605 [Thamnocephalis sphaerospora]